MKIFQTSYHGDPNLGLFSKCSEKFCVGVEQVATVARCSASHGKNERDRYIDSGKLEPGDKYLLRKKV